MGKGKIILILGPMFSGKTSELITLGKRYAIAKKKCLIIKYSGDTRYSEDTTLLSTHDEYSIKAIPLDKLEIKKEYDEYDVILIDEGQFFKDLNVFCDWYAEKGKVVVVAALNGKADKTPWDEVSLLLPNVTRTVFKTAICSKCGKSAEFSHSKKEIINSICIGGSETYEALCRECFSKEKKEKI